MSEQREDAPAEPAVGPPGETAAAEPEDAPRTVPLGEYEQAEDRLRRALADLDNLRKRCAREARQEREAERDRVAGAWLQVLDNLELALQHAEADPETIVAGVRAVRDQAVDLLAALGYRRHEEADVPFDPARHEVVSLADEPGADPNTVVKVVRPGYGEPGRQLRPAAVVVNRRQG
ncbi:nucleotide exchange factor GrpE [Peterkaempfera bronchialis]|uniref:Protein GrpE n=1 Tax=Peterkaempfera bronchialis TaxID=2126346 RepID=A0A345SS07_9ACTN|nr:nucleotide exchange factor GrpE [Peterkaempfera bronchialis]AXI76512.1 nucleotide exchange factor GrpE [Peterkaempfera bronchialis]